MITENDVLKLHETSLKVLSNIGIRVEHDAIVARLLKNGAKQGSATNVVRFEREFVMDMMSRAPSKVYFADRCSDGYEITARSKPRFWSTPGLKIWRKNCSRLFTSKDMADTARLLNELASVSGVFGLAMDDIPPKARDVVGLRIMAENTKKHIRVAAFTPMGAECLVKMKDVVSKKPWFSTGFTAHGPLRWTKLALDIFEKTAGHGIPVTINGEPMAGASGPVTLAGSAVVGNAEILAGIIINQILEPGRPCIYNLGLAHIFDMRNAVAVTGGPENHIFADISAAMGRFYNLPSCSWVSTESHAVDSQSALEKAIGFATHYASGVSLIWAVGQLESELSFSPAQALIDDEIIRYLERYYSGAKVSDETIALSAIHRVGIAGDYLADEHTLTYFKNEFFEPKLLYRKRREIWEEEGNKTLADRAEEQVDEILNKNFIPCLNEEQSKELRAIEKHYLSAITS